ncbi:hypothetical protein F6X82_12200 [Enterococcus faecium]|nr:hypothetical protein F6X81_12080 [Enterococcus faecium]KAA9196875.1 hypothetical protein F6X82_12200 [Enterococcus faecium]KAA9197251.1 hypothetical protein F6X75_12205 [Enterococcus faecium]
MCCGNSILQKGLPFFYLHKIFYTLIREFVTKVMSQTFFLCHFFVRKSKIKVYTLIKSIYLDIMYLL